MPKQNHFNDFTREVGFLLVYQRLTMYVRYPVSSRAPYISNYIGFDCTVLVEDIEYGFIDV